ncbi:MAG: hypothetical protein OEM29_07670 [Thermoplasmata archaeon]|nr:hypothetical protein [Thermoplasmata archaeon]
MPFDLQALVDARVDDPFFSRKNTVFRSTLDGSPVVVKIFAEDAIEGALKEYSILEGCHRNGVSVPRPIGLSGNALVMEFVEGETLSEILDRHWLTGTDEGAKSRTHLGSIAGSVGAWLARFHSSYDSRTRRGDAIVRNFLIGQKGTTGLDFEESSESDVIDDIGEICTSVLSMHPMFTEEKVEFCRNVVDSYFTTSGLARRADVPSAVARAMMRYASFRKDGSSMVAKAHDIELHGIWLE